VLAALIIVFREVFEAGLIVGIVLAVTRSVPGRGVWIGAGVGAGVLGACVVALFAGALSAAFAGSGQELFNATILGIAVVMLTWHNVWMARHGRELAAELRAAGEAVVAGKSSLLALAVVVGVAVLREGAEVVLFLYGIIASEGSTGTAIFTGGVIGLALGALICSLTYFGLLRIPSRYLFAVTTVLIALLAAGMAAQAMLFLNQADLVTAFDTVLWDTSWLLSESSILGRALHTLIGYSDRPTGMQVIVYLTTLAVTFVLMKVFAAAPKPVATHRPAGIANR
jgi:high-affinity iron transporter